MGDIEEQAAVTKQTIARSDCLIPVEVTAEIVYVLYGWYKLPREKIAAKIRELIAAKPGLVEKSDVIFCAITLFEENPRLDFVDCLLAAYKKLFACNILTFDKDLQKQLSSQKQ
jgi:predicted nucleic-acid-binding protein